MIRGKRCDLGLGGYEAVSLEAARKAAQANVAVARAGGDPREVREAEEKARRMADKAAKDRKSVV